jgi:hypothetical protein
MQVSGPGARWRSSWLETRPEYETVLTALKEFPESYFFVVSDAGLSRVETKEMYNLEFKFGSLN